MDKHLTGEHLTKAIHQRDRLLSFLSDKVFNEFDLSIDEKDEVWWFLKSIFPEIYELNQKITRLDCNIF